MAEKYRFSIHQLAEPAAGINEFYDEVTVAVEYGVGDKAEFIEFMAQALREWYDGAVVELVDSDA